MFRERTNIQSVATAIALLSGIAACTASDFDFATNAFREDGFASDQFPIMVDMSQGAVLVGQQEIGRDDLGPRLALIDINAPLTVFDVGANKPIRRRDAFSYIFGKRQSTGEFTVPRGKLRATITELHPCVADECVVGEAAPLPVTAVIGADALSTDSLRLQLNKGQIRFLPTIGPSDSGERALVCDAVFSSPFRGGGTLFVGNTEVGFTGRRVAVSACVASRPLGSLPQGQRGVDVLLVASTAVGPTILSRTAYNRYQQITPGAPDVDSLPLASVWLPSGEISGLIATVPNIVLAADGPEGRGACRENYAHHLMFERNCEPGDDCPCLDGDSCGAPAIVELLPNTGIRVLVVDDNAAILQSLRNELRSDRAEVDGILGTGALALTEFDIDYPNNRLLVRCAGPDCKTRPTFEEAGDRTKIAACIASD